MATDSSCSSIQATHSSSSRMQSASSLDFASPAKILNFNLPIKLDTNNYIYIYWRAQVLSAIRALKLDDLISSSITPPSKFLTTESISDITIDPKVSEQFSAWNRLDNLLLCWLFATVSKGVMG
ncbi:hypothetical protein ACOSQ2_004131 [Xanthoceras sorbifolium]